MSDNIFPDRTIDKSSRSLLFSFDLKPQRIIVTSRSTSVENDYSPEDVPIEEDPPED